jgi:hypothetical protein
LDFVSFLATGIEKEGMVVVEEESTIMIWTKEDYALYHVRFGGEALNRLEPLGQRVMC